MTIHRRVLSIVALLHLMGGSITMGLLQSASRQAARRQSYSRTTIRLSSSSSSSSSAPGREKEDPQAELKRKRRELLDASKLSLAPMMEYTDRHFRYLVRLISNRTLLYTEMVAANALAHERADMIDKYRQENPQSYLLTAQSNYDDYYMRRYLGQAVLTPPAEGPCVLQLGGSDPEQMFQAAQSVLDMTERGLCDYTAININCGCPSPKVAGKGCFGAALMDDPENVADLADALHHGFGGRLPVTVKCRIGTDSDAPFTKQGYAAVDEDKEYAKLAKFIDTVSSRGIVTDFSVHARIAVLQKSFSPADNRKIPPLKYHYIKRLVEDFPQLTFTLNGGIESLSEVQERFDEAPELTGVMVGRAWAADPWSFAMTDRLLYQDENAPLAVNRRTILEEFGKHADAEEEIGDPVKIRRFIVKAITPLFAGEPRGKKYRIALGDIAGIPKQLISQGKSLEGLPKISELIMNAATSTLTDEVLERTPEESYERILLEEKKKIVVHGSGSSQRSDSVREWQQLRKQESNGVYEQMLASGDGTVAPPTISAARAEHEESLVTQQNKERDISSLLAWAYSNGVQTKNLNLEPDEASEVCFGVTTSEDTPAMTRVLKVPASLILSSARIQDELCNDFADDFSPAIAHIQASPYRSQISHFFLFIKVLIEHAKGEDSFWYPWMQSLPREFETAIAMDEDELEWLPPYAWALAGVERRHLMVFREALQKVSENFLRKTILNNDFIIDWAFQVVFTRAWRYPDDKNNGEVSSERCDIVPFGDMFNHNVHKNLELDYDSEDNFLAYSANTVTAGSPLHISYGRPTNPYRFLTIFGFCDTDMPEILSQVTLENPSKQHQDMGYDLDRMVFRTKDGAISQPVWDVLLFSILEQKPEIQKRFYESHVNGDEKSKSEIHKMFHLETCLTLKSHVDRTLAEMDEILTRMNAIDDEQKGLHSMYGLIYKNNQFVRNVFGMVKERVDGMIKAEVVRRREGVAA